MRSRSAKVIVSILMIVCIGVLVFSAIGFPNSGGPSTTSSTPQGQTTSGSSDTAATTVVLKPLELVWTDPLPTPALGLRRWPAESLLPVIHAADLAGYQGREPQDQPLQGITVILDPGHGGQDDNGIKDGGAQYPIFPARAEVMEKDITLQVALKTRTLLENLGAEVVMTRENDAWYSINSRVALVGIEILDKFTAELPLQGYETDAIDHLKPALESMIQINSDALDSGGRGIMQGVGVNKDVRLLLDIERQYNDVLFISLHCNALEGEDSVRGIQVYYQSNESTYKEENSSVKFEDSMTNSPAYTLFNDDARLKLATLLRDNLLVQQPGMKYEGKLDIHQANYGVLREQNLVGALVEMGFITNAADRQIMQDPAGQQSIAQAVADSVYAYYCQ